MKKNGLTAHCLIRNEERWIWYAINSVINYVDQILVFDTGSTDNTVKIVESIKSSKIIVEQKGIVDKKKFTQLRQEMLERTATAWFMILDGDEIWPKAAIRELTNAVGVARQEIEAIVVAQWMCQGDIFHYSKEIEELAEDRSGRRGFWLPRAWRLNKGLHAIGLYGVESFADIHDINVSYWELNRLKYLKHKFFHMSFLPRSSSIQKDRLVMMRAPKTKFSRGVSFPSGIQFPEVFFKDRPAQILSVWRHMTLLDKVSGLYYRTLNFLRCQF